jgi:hypothetical protein
MISIALQGPDLLGRAIAVADGMVLVEDGAGGHKLYQDPAVRVFQYEMPEGIDFYQNHVEYRIMHAAGMRKDTHTAPMWEELRCLSHPRIWAAAALLCRPHQSESRFYDSLAQQIREWLDTKPSERKFSRPLSPRQWASLMSGTVYNQADADRVVNMVVSGEL